MSCSARPATSPTLRPARSPARSRSTRAPKHYRLEWKARGVPLGVTRIGVHAGPAIVGNFGGGRLFDYTAYGDTINAAARLEAVNKQLGTRICVSAAAAERADGFLGRPVGDLVLRGRREPMRAFEPLAPEDAAQSGTRRPMSAPSPSSRRAIPARSPPSPRWSANGRPIALAQYHLKRLAQRRGRNADRDGVERRSKARRARRARQWSNATSLLLTPGERRSRRPSTTRADANAPSPA